MTNALVRQVTCTKIALHDDTGKPFTQVRENGMLCQHQNSQVQSLLRSSLDCTLGVDSYVIVFHWERSSLILSTPT
jgi:hypothetical protein